MKKIFYFLSMAVLMIMATGCEKGTNAIVEPVNEGEENILYSYHMIANGLVGGRVVDANSQLVANGFTMVSAGNYNLVENDYIINITFSDTNSDELVEVMDITFTPSEVKHDAKLTYDCFTEFVTLVGDQLKLFSNNTYCHFYGFQTPTGEWMALDGFGGLFGEVNALNVESGKFYWIDDTIEDFYMTEEDERTYSGMYTKLTGVESLDEESEDEYSIQINYSINQNY